jgi:acetyl esterase/lipase
MTWRISKYSKSRVLSIDYRIAPQSTFPAALHDYISAFFFLIDPPQGSGHIKYRPNQIIFSGDSAGGNLAIAAAIWLQQKSLPMPLAIAAMSPWLDLSHSMPSFTINDPYDYLPAQSADPKFIHDLRMHYYVSHNHMLQLPLVSPMFANQPLNCASFPMTLIQVGDAEKLRDESIIFASKFSNVRVEMYQDMVHVFHMMSPLDDFADLAIKRLGEFIANASVDMNGTQSKVVWCMRDKSMHDLENAMAIVDFGREELSKTNQWTIESQDAFERVR